MFFHAMTGDTGSDASLADGLPFVHDPGHSAPSQLPPSRRRKRPQFSRSSSLRLSSAQAFPHSRLRSAVALRSEPHSEGIRSKRSFSSFSDLPSPEPSEDESPVPLNARDHTREFSTALPTPPDSEDDEIRAPPNETARSGDQSAYPFPLKPVHLPRASENRVLYPPSRRRSCSKIRRCRASPSPDRFISSRSTPATSQSPAETFRVNKSPKLLLPNESLLRHGSATPDPFGPLRVARIRTERINNYRGGTSPTSRRPGSRIIGLTNISDLPPDPSGTQNRQASPGNVWNIGGSSQAELQAPIRGVSNGRGGFISSGSNAPMYESNFLDDLSTGQDVDQMERRLAAALEIDQVSKILNNSRPPDNPRITSTGSIGVKRKRLYLESRTTWKDCGWTPDNTAEGEPISVRSDHALCL